MFIVSVVIRRYPSLSVARSFVCDVLQYVVAISVNHRRTSLPLRLPQLQLVNTERFDVVLTRAATTDEKARGLGIKWFPEQCPTHGRDRERRVCHIQIKGTAANIAHHTPLPIVVEYDYFVCKTHKNQFSLFHPAMQPTLQQVLSLIPCHTFNTVSGL